MIYSSIEINAIFSESFFIVKISCVIWSIVYLTFHSVLIQDLFFDLYVTAKKVMRFGCSSVCRQKECLNKLFWITIWLGKHQILILRNHGVVVHCARPESLFHFFRSLLLTLLQLRAYFSIKLNLLGRMAKWTFNLWIWILFTSAKSVCIHDW